LIKVENDVAMSVTANCIEFMPDGKSILTGWTDGKIRAFTP
jgi:WD40 repeat protein